MINRKAVRTDSRDARLPLRDPGVRQRLYGNLSGDREELRRHPLRVREVGRMHGGLHVPGCRGGTPSGMREGW